MKTLHIGIIGFGEMGKRHGLEFMESSQGQVRVKAVVEISDKKYEQGCQWCACQPARYKDVASFLAREKCDGIIISTPNFTHYDMLKHFTGLNIPILLEKPLDADIENIFRIVRFARDYQGPIMVHHVMRFAPIVKKAAEIINEGKIGKICSVNFVQYMGGGMWHSAFRRTLAGGGGMLIEKATHDFDVMLNLINALPVRIAAVSKQQAYGGNKPNDLHCRDCDERMTCPESYFEYNYKPGAPDIVDSNAVCVFAGEVDVPDNETCLIEFEKNIFGNYSHCYFINHYFSREYEVIGLKGTMRISFTPLEKRCNGKITLAPRYGTDCNHAEYNFHYYNKIHYNGGPGVVRHFVDIMNGHAAPETTVEQAFAAEMIGYAAGLSARQGEFVKISDILPADLKAGWAGIKLAGPESDIPL